jgi:cell division septation protein DedD
MKGKIRYFHPLTVVSVCVIFIPIVCGCAGTGKTGTTSAIEQEPAAVEPRVDSDVEEISTEEPGQADEPYDLESEMPEDDSVEEEESAEEMIEPVRTDTFTVEETVEPPAPASGYDLGYRIQLAAFAESAAARDLKKKVMAALRMSVYIDYEDGLYKVRAGDFDTRAEASEARSVLSGDYPDCWIVRTTIMKSR